jgi:hypothetical protein
MKTVPSPLFCHFSIFLSFFLLPYSFPIFSIYPSYHHSLPHILAMAGNSLQFSLYCSNGVLDFAWTWKEVVVIVRRCFSFHFVNKNKEFFSTRVFCFSFGLIISGDGTLIYRKFVRPRIRWILWIWYSVIC